MQRFVVACVGRDLKETPKGEGNNNIDIYCV
jgi:hypothetical protein